MTSSINLAYESAVVGGLFGASTLGLSKLGRVGEVKGSEVGQSNANTSNLNGSSPELKRTAMDFMNSYISDSESKAMHSLNELEHEYSSGHYSDVYPHKGNEFSANADGSYSGLSPFYADKFHRAQPLSADLLNSSRLRGLGKLQDYLGPESSTMQRLLRLELESSFIRGLSDFIDENPARRISTVINLVDGGASADSLNQYRLMDSRS